MGQDTGLELGDLTDRIIGAAIAVHRSLGPGFVESVYELALAVEFDLRGLDFERQIPVRIVYKNRVVGLHRLDFFVAEEVVVELKTVKRLEDIHFSITRSYLKAVRKRHGLLLNFLSPTLDVRRVLLER